MKYRKICFPKEPKKVKEITSKIKDNCKEICKGIFQLILYAFRNWRLFFLL
jgi:hypothetical protein